MISLTTQQKFLANINPNFIIFCYWPQVKQCDHFKMDARTEAALDALDEILLRPELGREFLFETGQIQILNNRKIAHRRTRYTDWPEPDRKRHLARLWLRDHGRKFYMG